MDLKSGQGTEADWNTLQLRLVVGLKLAQDYFNNEALVEMHRALVVLSCIHASVAGRANGWYVTLDEALLLGPALWLTDMMQEQCSSQESAKSIHAAQVALGLS